jgi:catechol 2,3-dioxygenase-like lactoylglutathione lyase family enzyme
MRDRSEDSENMTIRTRGDLHAATLPDDANGGRVLGIYHLNINVTNLERSRAFYELFGFRVVDTFHERHNAALDKGLGLPADTNSENRALFMMVGNNRHATVIDLAEWVTPKSPGSGSPEPNRLGIPRFCLRVKHIDALVARLKVHGVEFLSDEPQRLDTLKRKPRFICCRDPDGLLVEMVEL